MNKDQLSILKNMRNQWPEKPVLCVIKGRYQFISDLSDLDVASTISVLLMNSALKGSLLPYVTSRFDVILWFDGGEFWSGSNTLANLDKLQIPDLELVIEHLCTIVDDCGLIRLVAMEEQFVRFTAEIRQRFNISGPKPFDVAPYTDKVQMKKVAGANNIRTSKYEIIDLDELKCNESNLVNLEQKLPYPIFMKPVNGVGAAGTKKISNRQEMQLWLNCGDVLTTTAYMAEEFIEGRELFILGFCQDGQMQLVPSIFTSSVSIYRFLSNGQPMSEWATRENCDQIVSFVQNIEKAFGHLDGSLFFVQMFDTSTGFVLNEIACRVPGVIGSALFQQNSGINPEAVQIMGQVKKLKLYDFPKPTAHFGMVVYPKRASASCKLQDPPTHKLSSRTYVQWGVKDGDTLKVASNIGDVVARVHVWNSNFERLLQDLTYLEHNYDPLT